MVSIKDQPSKRKFKKKSYRAWNLSGDSLDSTESTTPEPIPSESQLSEKPIEEKAAIKQPEENITIPSPSKASVIKSPALAETITYIETRSCIPWEFSDRSEDEMGNIEELANSIRVNGQQEPALVRPIDHANPDIKYEVIFGHRRFLACKLAGVKLFAIIKPDLNDKDAAAAQKEENENREDLSAYSKARNYQKMLDKGTFSSERELATKLNIPSTTFNRMMSYNKIDSNLVAAFKNIHNLSLLNAERLYKATKNMTATEVKHLRKLIPDIESGRLPIQKIRLALDKRPQNETTTNEYDSLDRRFFKNDMGVKLFSSTRNHNGSPTFTFYKLVSDNELVEDIEKLVFDYLNKRTKIDQ